MPIQYTIHPDANWIDVTGSETIEEQDLRSVFQTYISDPVFRPGMHVLVDLQNAELRADTAIVRNFVDMLEVNQSRRGKDYCIALLVQRGFQETLSHLFSIYVQNRPVKCEVFTERDAALEWLVASNPP